MAEIWDRFLTDADRAIYAASGYGAPMRPPRRPGLLVIDVTMDFCGPRGLDALAAVRSCRTACGPASWAAVPVIAALIAAARAGGAPVVYTRRDAARLAARRTKTARATEDGAGGNEIVADLAPRRDEPVLGKPRPSAFYDTELPALLDAHGCDGVILTGGTTSGCVRATAVDAFNLGIPAFIVPEAVFDRFESSHAMSLFDLQAKYADLVTAENAADMLRAYHAPNPRGSKITPR